jgi:hypothetical protein
MWLLLALVLVLTAYKSDSASLERPSFDCAKASREDEKAICADPALATLDRSIDAAYRTARERLQSDSAALKHLSQKQSLMLSGRLGALAHPFGVGLRDYLARWRDALARIAEPRAGFEGGWTSLDTIIEVKGRPDGRFSVKLQGSDPVRGSWTCGYDGLGEKQGERLVVTWDRETDDEDGADGWLLELTRMGSLLRVRELPGPDAAPSPPYCGVHGGLAGDYMPADAAAFAKAHERVGYER